MAESLDIAFVSNVVYPFVTGGAQKRIHEIGTRLVERGHTITVYSRKWWGGSDDTTVDGVRLRAVAPARDLYAGDRRSIGEALSFALRVVPPLRAHCLDHDLVVVSVFPYFPVFTSALSRMQTGVPLATTWHEVWDDYWWEYLGTLGGCGLAVERLATRVPQHPIAVSEFTADRLAALGVERSRIKVVPNGVHTERIESIPPAPDGFEILFVGRLIPEKQLDTAIRACERLSREFRFGIIGEGPDRARLERLAAGSSVADQIEFLGHLDDHDEVLAHMKAADGFLLPSTREGFGIAIVEAMAAGCTVVAVESPNSAATDVLADGGFTAPLDEAKIADCLRRVLDGERPPTDPTQVATRYDWSTVASLAERRYREIIEVPA